MRFTNLFPQSYFTKRRGGGGGGGGPKIGLVVSRHKGEFSPRGVGDAGGR